MSRNSTCRPTRSAGPVPASVLLSSRHPFIDQLRGFAIGLMLIYHFCYDLVWFGFTHFRFLQDPLWMNFRGLIVGSFVTLVGISLALSTRHGLRWPPYLRRLGWLALCAALVSIGSYLAFPQRYIFFGVLHFIALASVLSLGFLRFYWLNLIFGLLLLGVGLSIKHPLFDQASLQWFGLMTHPPATEDYVPLLPWFGLVLIGLFIGRHISRHQPYNPLGKNHVARFLARAGRHSLLIYMLHQPILLSLLFIVHFLIA